jgi:hypothetical protein
MESQANEGAPLEDTPRGKSHKTLLIALAFVGGLVLLVALNMK